MDPMTMMMLGMMASGVGMDFFGMDQQRHMANMGSDTERAAIDAQLAMTRTKSEDEALQNMINLRQNLGSQLAVQAARGTASNAGSAVALQQASVQSFSKDESARKLNLLSNETLLKNAKYMSEVQRLSTISQAKQGFFKNTMSTLSGGLYAASKSGSGASNPSSPSSGNAGTSLQGNQSQYKSSFSGNNSSPYGSVKIG